MSWRENSEKYKTVSVQIEKEITNVHKVGNENIITISWKTNLFDSAKFMASSLWNLVDNVAKWIHKIKCYKIILQIQITIMQKEFVKILKLKKSGWISWLVS